MRIDGSDRTKITDEKPITLIKHFDWIYFQRNAEMYKVNIIDGTIESLGINNVGQINILDKYIIYSGFYSNKGGLYKISTDGRENTKIIQDEKEIKEINIIDGWIYFRKWTNKYKNSKAVAPILYRIRIDGTNLERIGE